MVSVGLIPNMRFRERLADVEPKYFLEIQAELDYPPGPVRLPVYWRQAPSRIAPEAYRAEVCGYRLERANLVALRKDVARTVWLLTWRRRLPAYIVIARDFQVVPAYPAEGGLEAPVADGPVLTAADISGVVAGLRGYLQAACLKADLTVGRVSPRDLRLEAPVAVLFSPNGADVWVPVFSDAGGLVCRWQALTFGGEGYAGAAGLLRLRRELAARLPGRQVSVAVFSAEDLGRVEAGCQPTGLGLPAVRNGARLDLRVLRFGPEYLVCDPEALAVHVGSVEELRARVAVQSNRRVAVAG